MSQNNKEPNHQSTCTKCGWIFSDSDKYNWHINLEVPCVVPVSDSVRQQQTIKYLRAQCALLQQQLDELKSIRPARIHPNTRLHHYIPNDLSTAQPILSEHLIPKVSHPAPSNQSISNSQSSQLSTPFNHLTPQESSTKTDNGVVMISDTEGVQLYYKDGKLHRDGDLPAIIYPDGRKKWCKDGVLHRDGDLPAIVYPDSSRLWYRRGELHRDGDLPAIFYRNGYKSWYKKGKLHRDGDLPAIIYPDGEREWCKNGVLHRDGDKPAIVKPDGYQAWYVEGNFIRDLDK